MLETAGVECPYCGEHFETTADTSPGMIRPVGDSDFLHVIMPMHLGN